MSIFRRAFSDLFSSPRSSATIVNNSMKVNDDDNNSYSEGDEIQDSSDTEENNVRPKTSPGRKESNGNSKSPDLNGGGDKPEVTPRKRRKQSTPRRSLVESNEQDEDEEHDDNESPDANIDSEPELGKLQIFEPEDEVSDPLEEEGTLNNKTEEVPTRKSDRISKSRKANNNKRTVSQETENGMASSGNSVQKKKPTLKRKSSRLTTSSDSETTGSPDKLANEKKKASWSSVVTRGKPPIKCPYLYEEDEALLRYLSKSNKLAGIRGRALWEEAERDNASKSLRTWHSLKERFRKMIISNIHQYKCLNPAERDRIIGYWERTMPDSLAPHVGIISKPKVQADSEMNESHSTIEGSSSKKKPKERKKLPTRKAKVAAQKVLGEESSEDETDEKEASDGVDKDNFYLKYVTKAQKLDRVQPSSRGYTKDEDIQLMAVVYNRCKNKEIPIGGNAFWVEAEKEFEDRTWQSLKERFLRRIIPQLSTYCVEEEINQKVVNRLMSIPGVVKTPKEREDIIAACQKVFKTKSRK